MLRNRPLLLLTFMTISLTVLADTRMPAAIVQVATAKNMEIAPFVWVTGTVISRYDSRIAAEVEGRLESVLDVGDRVNKGSMIAKVNDKIYRLKADEIQSEIKPIKTMVAFYRKESDRLQKLSQKNNVAKNQLEQVRANHDEALARISTIKTRLALAQDDLANTIIRAPFSGVISERIKSQGEWVNTGEQLVRLTDTGKREVQAYVQQSSLKFIKPGHKDQLTVKRLDQEIQGIVRTMIPVGDEVSRLYEIRIEFDKEDWIVGTAVQVAIPVAQKQDVITVPRDALVIRQSGIFIYRINDNNIAEIVPVKTGISNMTHIQVLGNINESDRIVIRGNERLRPGQAVKIIDRITS